MGSGVEWCSRYAYGGKGKRRKEARKEVEEEEEEEEKVGSDECGKP